MIRYAVIAAMVFASCAGNGDTKNDTSDTTNTPRDTALTGTALVQDKKYCFVRTEGAANQDTTTVYFIVKGNEITGQMNWLPKEKDSRKGTLRGTVNSDTISAVWTFMQEGMKDSIPVAFKLQPNKLTQKPLKINTANGREETDETMGYSLEYNEGDCGY